jgi:hypothetical protein
MNKVKFDHHLVTVSAEMKADLQVWVLLLKTSNAAGFSSKFHSLSLPSSHNTVDACNLGIGVFFNGETWYKPWPEEINRHINIKELAAAVVHADKFAHLWSGSVVHLGSDNTQAVSWINRLRARPPEAMPWIKHLFWLSVKFDFELVAIHVPGIQNTIADAVSRNLLPTLAEALSLWHSTHLLLPLSSPSPSSRPALPEDAGYLGTLLQME